MTATRVVLTGLRHHWSVLRGIALQRGCSPIHQKIKYRRRRRNTRGSGTNSIYNQKWQRQDTCSAVCHKMLKGQEGLCPCNTKCDGLLFSGASLECGLTLGHHSVCIWRKIPGINYGKYNKLPDTVGQLWIPKFHTKNTLKCSILNCLNWNSSPIICNNYIFAKSVEFSGPTRQTMTLHITS